MSFIKEHKKAFAAAVFIAAVLTAAYFFGGTPNDAPAADNAAVQTDIAQSGSANEPNEQAANGGENENADSRTETDTPRSDADIKHSEQSGTKTNESTIDEYNTEPVPAGNPTPVEPQTEQITDTELTCTLSVRCDTAVGKSADKAAVIPGDGIIFHEQQVTFYEGESVFNLLVREMKKNKIHLEFVNTPVYNSAYIEGIGNLYEFDCGELSGWMYRVNGWFPNYGCSRYEIKNGDKIEWVYTCDLGKDVGGGYSARNGAKNE